jgi:hypothetical protein
MSITSESTEVTKSVAFFIAEFPSNAEPDHYTTAAANLITLYWVQNMFYYH